MLLSLLTNSSTLILKLCRCPKQSQRAIHLGNITSKRQQEMEDAEQQLAQRCKYLPPPLSNDRHKGEAGRVGIFGGSLDYTGAPYFAGMSALRVGGDLVHIFCVKEAGPVIKSYSPELIVHPVLDSAGALKQIEPWLERLHVILIGPGLGRSPGTLELLEDVVHYCKAAQKPFIVDADGLYFLSKRPRAFYDYPGGVILTPNVNEYKMLAEGLAKVTNAAAPKLDPDAHLDFGKAVTILRKGTTDDIFTGDKVIRLSGGGSGRRCGGQGDVLSGVVAVFFNWALQNKTEGEVKDKAALACYAASKLVRKCNERAFAKKGRSMVVSDMLDEIGGVFKEMFESP